MAKGNRRRAARLAVLTGVMGAAAMAAAAPVLAQDRAVVAPSERRMNFDIPAQALDRAVLAFAERSGFQVIFDATRVQGMHSAAVRGSLAPTDALARLLAGTGLRYRFTGPNAVSLEAGTAAGTAGAAVQLDPVRIGGTGAAFGIHPPVDDGYRADRIVSSTRTDTPLVDVPQSITVVTRKQMEDQNVQSMAEAVRYVPGVGFAQGEGNRDTPVFRGNSTTSDFFIDGIRDDIEYFRDVYNIERIEVLKGPNGLAFGRGGVGGVINRVTRQADWATNREIKLETGSNDHYRATFDVGQGVSEMLAVRLTGLYQNSDSYRDGYELERWGINPTASLRLGEDTLIQFGYEHFEDKRTADRGIPSFRGRPLDVSAHTFFGDPDQSPTTARVDAVNLAVEHRFNRTTVLRNRTRYADYDKRYQNVFPGAVSSDGSTVQISAYNNATQRETFVNQTDLNLEFNTGFIRHTLLAGVEYSHQTTKNFRNTGFFDTWAPGATSITLPVSSPMTYAFPVSFRQGATDADNRGTAKSVGAYLQDQIEFSPQFQAIVGVRYDRFDVDFKNNRNGQEFSATDNLWSPRVGLIYKPIQDVSVYASYSNTYLPRAGSQLSSLSLSNQALDPEQFVNYEVGVKWDFNSRLMLSAALYQLDRKNVAVTDTVDPTRSVLVDGQRTKGLELSASGKITDRWSVIASYAYQDGKLTAAQSATVPAGAVLANLPEHTIALWNRYDVTDALGVGVGVLHQSKRYASTDNQVALPSFTRVDAALFYAVTDNVDVQLNVENVFGEKYYPNAHSNNNITPGAPRTFKVGLTTRF